MLTKQLCSSKKINNQTNKGDLKRPDKDYLLHQINSDSQIIYVICPLVGSVDTVDCQSAVQKVEGSSPRLDPRFCGLRIILNLMSV